MKLCYLSTVANDQARKVSDKNIALLCKSHKIANLPRVFCCFFFTFTGILTNFELLLL